ncbi:hypothetical protein CTT31_17205 [Pseudoalteromonas maricaloris]|uniref:hypothetical protein n=1 Tax=Pseudoalteromonas maricaloris TaxID=184924 RepID=UPI0021ADEAB7|nr:hypothetical protein [Pseudoalteromonas flavipulchra]USE70762.1 hypothetical protein CTT31_17205 [Pseudoalteromonas flavipulchra]
MNAYILRCKPHGFNREQEFLDGRISIGWPCGTSLANKSREEVAKTLAGRYADLSEISVSMVNLFVDMPANSIVLTPSISNKALIHIFKTTSVYQYDSDADQEDVGNPHYVTVELLKTVSRADLPPAVIRSLSGARKTLSQISQHYDLLDDYIVSGFEAESAPEVTCSGNKAEALNVLYELLASENETIRLNAAIAILNNEKN